jgi:UDP-N-acetylglucosamine 2-epimerase
MFETVLGINGRVVSSDKGNEQPSSWRRETTTKKIVTVIGARPQFIKAAPVRDALAKLTHDFNDRRGITEIVVHTGQHYDFNMSGQICGQLGLTPAVNLGINGGTHGEQTAAMIRELEKVFVAEIPAMVLLYGDTNSTLAGALAAAKLGIAIAHVEAGLRSFNRAMPEEINRVLTDHVANILFAPTETAVRNLLQEGIKESVFLVGDVMYDAVQQNLIRARQASHILNDLGLQSKGYILATIHRAENTTAEQLQLIVDALGRAGLSSTVVWPMHPRTRQVLERAHIAFEDIHGGVRIIEPASYLDMLALESNAKTIVTDSGGIQKEAAWLGVPCVTVRNETEWVETVQSGWNVVVGTVVDSILDAIDDSERRARGLVPFPVQPGAADAVAKHLVEWLM